MDLTTKLNRRSRHEGGAGLFVVSADPVRVMWQWNSRHRGMRCCWLAVQGLDASFLSVGTALALRQ